MGFSAMAAATVAAGKYSADKAKKGAEEQARATREAAERQAQEQARIAEQQRVEAERQAAELKRQEEARIAAQREQEAEQRRQLADADVAALADNTPNVQLNAGAAGGGATEARKRRANFRPEYASGITI